MAHRGPAADEHGPVRCRPDRSRHGVAGHADKKKQTDLIRKALEGSTFIADHSADLPTALTSCAEGNLPPLPTGYEDVGWVDKDDGATWSR